jgi:Mg-chelatase subunit ChlD
MRKITRKQKGIVVIIRDISGSVCEYPTDRVVRDATLFLISECKKAKHRMSLIDFASYSNQVPDKSGNILTTEYDNIMLKSSFLKGGGSTRIQYAIKRLNDMIAKENLSNIPLNIYVITDTFISNIYGENELKINHPKFNLTTIAYNNSERHLITKDYNRFNRMNNGKIFFIELSPDKKLIKSLLQITSK